MSLRSTHKKKIGTHDIPTSNNLGLTKYSQEKACDREYLRENLFDLRFWTHEIAMRKYFGTTKYPRRHDGGIALDPLDSLWHLTHQI